MRMPFGKYQGCCLIDLPEHYVVWFAGQGFPEGKLGNMLRAVYEIKVNGLEQITPGDTVRVTTKDGMQREFTVKEATAQQLIGESEKVNFSDITSIERREFSGWKTGGLTMGIVTVVTVILAVILVSSMKVTVPSFSGSTQTP